MAPHTALAPCMGHTAIDGAGASARKHRLDYLHFVQSKNPNGRHRETELYRNYEFSFPSDIGVCNTHLEGTYTSQVGCGFLNVVSSLCHILEI